MTPDEPVERRVREEAEDAAAEAGSIGGPASPEPADEAERPLAEAGGGVAEGFEEAERELIEHASHGDPAPDPGAEAFLSEDPQAAEAERGEPDREHSSQREDDRQR